MDHHLMVEVLKAFSHFYCLARMVVMAQGKKVVVEPHRHEGVFIARGKEDALVTKNMAIGESVYGEKRIAVEDEAGKVEYRVWNPFRSKLAAAILGGVDKIH